MLAVTHCRRCSATECRSGHLRHRSHYRCSLAEVIWRSFVTQKHKKRGLSATYEKTVQSAFKDVANALARRTTLEEQLDAQRQSVKAEQQTVDVGLRRYQAGVGDYLTVLTAQRSLWSAQQALLALQLTDFTNRITLWQSLGGGMSSLK